MLIGPWRLRGISKYIRSITKKEKVLYLSPKTNLETFLPEDKTVKFGFKSYFLWEQISLPIKLLSIPHNYVLYPSTTAPILINRKKSILVVYDLIFTKNVNTKTPKQKLSKLYRRLITSINIKLSKRIICISEFTKNEIITNYNIRPSQKITVIHCSLEDKWFELDKNVVDGNKYFLTVTGSLESKNLIRVLKAFKKFNSSIHNEYKLKIVGISGNKDKSFRKELEKLNLLKNVVIIPSIDDKQLITLYDNASLSLTLSIHEGFGFPVVESMARKTPVLISNCSSIPEVGGPHALYANPFDVDDIVSKLNLFHRMNEVDRMEMVIKNYNYSKQFIEYQLDKKVNLFWSGIRNKN